MTKRAKEFEGGEAKIFIIKIFFFENFIPYDLI